MENKVTRKHIDKRLAELNLSVTDAAKELGMTRQNLNNHLRKDELSEHFVRLFKEKIGLENKLDVKGNIANDPQGVYGKETAGIPVYDAIATGSPNENISQLSGQPLFRMYLPGYEDCDRGIYHYGHSMYPTIESGNLLLLKPVNDKTIIMYGEIYVVHTRDYFMVKRLQKNNKSGHVLCTSDNFEKRSEEFRRFEPFDMPIDKIITLYLVKGIIRKTQS